MADLELSHYSTTPLFNTKAVVQETGVSAATLRAWERRYGVPMPDRTQSNYRLYSERDIALIRWLRERVEAGISISQSVELYRRVIEGQEVPNFISGEPRYSAETEQSHDFTSSQARLLAAFKSFDEPQVERLLSDLFALYPLEEVILSVLQPVLVEIGEQWHRGEVSVQVEHFSTGYVERKLMALMSAQPYHPDAPLVIVACAPDEQHELGLLFFSFFLRRQGLRVLYLGQNVPLVDMRATLETLRPAMFALSAMSRETAEGLPASAALVREMRPPRPLFAFGGGVFLRHPELIRQLPGLYLGDDARSAAHAALHHIRQEGNL